MDSPNMFRTFLLSLATWILATGFAVAAQSSAQQVTIAANAPLLSEPRADSAVVAQLKQGTAGEQIGKQGMFVNLKTPAGSGWVMSFNVRYPASGAPSVGGSGGGGINTSGRVVTATIGIRGLSAEDLRKTSVDPEQLKLLDSYAASAQDGEAAASASGLAAVRLDYFNK